MATLTIKNIPDAVYRRIKRQASQRRRSLNQEVIACLEQFTGSVAIDPETFLAKVRSLRVKPHKGLVTDRLVTTLKRQGRL